MKVAGIVGSMRKNGNTHRLVEAVLQGAEEQVKLLFIKLVVIRD